MCGLIVIVVSLSVTRAMSLAYTIVTLFAIASGGAAGTSKTPEQLCQKFDALRKEYKLAPSDEDTLCNVILLKYSVNLNLDIVLADPGHCNPQLVPVRQMWEPGDPHFPLVAKLLATKPTAKLLPVLVVTHDGRFAVAKPGWPTRVTYAYTPPFTVCLPCTDFFEELKGKLAATGTSAKEVFFPGFLYMFFLTIARVAWEGALTFGPPA